MNKPKTTTTSQIAGSICGNKSVLLESLIIATNNLDKQGIGKNTDTLNAEWKKVWEKYSMIKTDYKQDMLDHFFWSAHYFGIWDNDYNLSKLAQKVLNKEITPEDYLDVFILNYVIKIDNKTYNPLICLLEYLIENNYQSSEITNDTICNAMKKISDNWSKESTNDKNKYIEKHKDRHLHLLFKGTNYFEWLSKQGQTNKSKLKINPQELLDKCNRKYHDQPVQKFEADNSNWTENSIYLTTGFSANRFDPSTIQSSFGNNENEDFRQKIYYGAPGTGKSYFVDQKAKKIFGNNYERVTFHNNYTYANFIGTYKPVPKDGQEDVITYSYVPGVLTKLLVKALKNPEQNYLLIIEEINRAHAAAVFGDFFQLLDRDGNYKSEYKISASEDLTRYFKKVFNEDEENIENIHTHLGQDYDQVILPSNLFIWATMNSADQGVMPIDTAFKRRWETEYIHIDKNEELIKGKYQFNIGKDQMTWNDFRKTINNYLSSSDLMKINEDKLMGTYFISKKTLEDFSDKPAKLSQVIKNKVLYYLFDDVVKPYRTTFFDSNKANTFLQLCDNFDQDGIEVFNQHLKEKLNQIIKTKTTESETEDKKELEN